VDAHTRRGIPVIGIAAISGTGKTTLLLRLIPLKRAHHTFDTDKPGKDSYELRKAGAAQVLVGSSQRWALIVENETGIEPEVDEFLRNMRTDLLDLVIVEGFKAAPIPKIELHRPSLGHPLLAANDHYVIAVATDDARAVNANVPLLDMNRPEDIASFIVERLGIRDFGLDDARSSVPGMSAMSAARRVC
jgi:molybdopterin-guanine dinucleotide biosynthesis protein B